MRDVTNSKPLKVFVKGAFVLIGLIFVLSYGFAALILYFDRNIEISKNYETNKNIENNNNYEIVKKIEIENKDEINKNNKTGKSFEWKVIGLIFFLVCFPIILFIIVSNKFSNLVKLYYEKLYGSSNNEGIIIKMQQFEMQKLKIHKIEALIELFFTAIKTIKPDSKVDWKALLKKIKKIIKLLSKMKQNNCEKKTSSNNGVKKGKFYINGDYSNGSVS